jgi:hypothetical protein
MYPTWFQGYCKEGRPVLYKRFGIFDMDIMSNEFVGVTNLIRYHEWETIKLIQLATLQTQQTGVNIETFVVVIDAEGWNLSLANRKTMEYIRGMTVADQARYPERLGVLLVINAPRVISILWRMISPLLDSVTKSKIKIISASDDWQSILKGFISEDQIPKMFGGTANNLTPEEAVESHRFQPPDFPSNPDEALHNFSTDTDCLEDSNEESADFYDVGTQCTSNNMGSFTRRPTLDIPNTSTRRMWTVDKSSQTRSTALHKSPKKNGKPSWNVFSFFGDSKT